MVNKYAAACAGCGGRVLARQGTTRKSGGRWITRHNADGCNGGSTAVDYYDADDTDDGEPIFRMTPGGCHCEDYPCCGC